MSTPVSGREVEEALRKKDASRWCLRPKTCSARVDKVGDLFKPVQELKQKLPQLSGLVREAQPDRAEASPSKKSGVRTGPNSGVESEVDPRVRRALPGPARARNPPG